MGSEMCIRDRLTLWLWYAAALASLGPLVQLIARSDVPEAARHDRSTDECTNPLRPIAVAATFKAADSTPNAVKALNTRVATTHGLRHERKP